MEVQIQQHQPETQPENRSEQHVEVQPENEPQIDADAPNPNSLEAQNPQDQNDSKSYKGDTYIAVPTTDKGGGSSIGQNYTAVVVGATGAIGRCLIKELVESEKCTRVTALVRKVDEDVGKAFNVSAEAAQKKLRVQQIDFDRPEDHKDYFSADVGFCCLGTTKRIAGSEAGFRKVDLEYVVNTAKLMKAQGVRSFSLVTAAGASQRSLFLYPKTKGEAEARCGAIGFDHYTVWRPGLLLVKREGPRQRDMFWQRITPSVWSVEVAIVARAMRVHEENGHRDQKRFEFATSHMKSMGALKQN